MTESGLAQEKGPEPRRSRPFQGSVLRCGSDGPRGRPARCEGETGEADQHHRPGAGLRCRRADGEAVPVLGRRVCEGDRRDAAGELDDTVPLLSENGMYDLTNLTFDNFYSRAYDEMGNIWYTASIVAMEDFNIRHSIMAPSAGTTKATAFRMLMLEVEMRLSDLLRESSNASAMLPKLSTPQTNPSVPPLTSPSAISQTA